MATAATCALDSDTDTLHIEDLTIHDGELVAFLEEFDEERREQAVTECLKIGAKTLQLAETATEMEYVKREFEGMQTEVEGEIESLHDELERTFGEDGTVTGVLDRYLGDNGRLNAELEAVFDDDGLFVDRLDDELGENGERIQEALDPDREGTPTFRLKQTLKEELNGIRDQLLEEEAQAEVRGNTTLKGEDFETDVEGLLDEWVYGTQHTHSFTGGTEGALSGRTVGDFVLELGDIGQRIVIEAKSDQSYSEPKIKAEMSEALENREADYGIFLCECEEYVPKKIGYLQEYEDFVVVCVSRDDDDEIDPRLFHIGLNWACMRAAEAGMGAGEEIDPAIIQTNIEEARAAVERFSTIKSKCTTIKKNANAIEETLDEIATQVQRQLADVEVELRGR